MPYKLSAFYHTLFSLLYDYIHSSYILTHSKFRPILHSFIHLGTNTKHKGEKTCNT